jgi:hypothetical protein
VCCYVIDERCENDHKVGEESGNDGCCLVDDKGETGDEHCWVVGGG